MRRWRVFTGCVYTGTYSLGSALTVHIQVGAGVLSLQIRMEEKCSYPHIMTSGT